MSESEGAVTKSNKGTGKPEKKKGYDKHGNKVKYDPNFKKKQVPVYTREERKELRVKRRDARPNAEIVLKANTTLWSQSLSNMKGAERVERVGEILKTLEGKIGDVASKHDVSRAIQCCLKHGSKGQRAKVLGELKPHIVSLATSKYAHHLVLKLIQLGDKETQRIIRDEFSGKCVKLGLRSDAAKVIDLLYATGNAQEQQKLLAEFYGKEYIIRIKSGEAAQALSEIVAQSADVRQQVVAHIGGWIAKFVNKEMLMFRFVHALILNYWTYGTAADHDKLLADICSNPMALHHSADGAQVLCTILSQGTAKTRKEIIKGLKGKVCELLVHRWGHLVLMRAVMVTDDTVLLTKSLLNELIDNRECLREEVLSSPNCGRLLQAIFNPEEQVSRGRVVERKMFESAARVEVGADGKETVVTTSRKPVEQRRDELLKYLMPKLLKSLISGPAAGEGEADQEMEDESAMKVEGEAQSEDENESDAGEEAGGGEKTVKSGEEKAGKSRAVRPSLLSRMKSKLFGRMIYDTLMHCAPELRGPLCAAMAAHAAAPGVLEDLSAHILLKRLLVNLAPDASALATPLLAALRFVLIALMGAGGKEVTKEVLDALRPHVKAIAAKESPGTRLLVQAITTGKVPAEAPEHGERKEGKQVGAKNVRNHQQNHQKVTPGAASTVAGEAKHVSKKRKADEALVPAPGEAKTSTGAKPSSLGAHEVSLPATAKSTKSKKDKPSSVSEPAEPEPEPTPELNKVKSKKSKKEQKENMPEPVVSVNNTRKSKKLL